MSLQVVFRLAAKEEFEEAAAWYENQSPGLGAEFLREIDEVISSAAAPPRRGIPSRPVMFAGRLHAVSRIPCSIDLGRILLSYWPSSMAGATPKCGGSEHSAHMN